MRKQQVDRYLGIKVAITFQCAWFNEAVQTWVSDEEEYVGVLTRCGCPNQEKYYQLESPQCLPTDKACFSANRIKRIKLMEDVTLWL